MSKVNPAHRPVEEIRNEFCRISEELHAAEKAEAMESYKGSLRDEVKL